MKSVPIWILSISRATTVHLSSLVTLFLKQDTTNLSMSQWIGLHRLMSTHSILEVLPILTALPTRPEDQNLMGKRAQWVTPDILAKRREENRCLRCGRDNCRVATCPLKMAKRPGMPAPHSLSHRTIAKRAIVTEAQFEDDDGMLGDLEDEQLKA